MREPRGTTTSPRRPSAPAGTTFSPALTERLTITVASEDSVYSTMTTASAPLGTGAPVMISTASPAPVVILLSSSVAPALMLPTHCRRAGTACTSAARTAYPSRVARGKGGKSRSARKSSARTRPTASKSVDNSGSVGVNLAACCSTARRASANESSLLSVDTVIEVQSCGFYWTPGNRRKLELAGPTKNRAARGRPGVQRALDQGFFLAGAFCWPNEVSTWAPMLASICLAASAFLPLGSSSRYLLKASAVPGGAIILPLLSVVALPIMLTPFQ